MPCLRALAFVTLLGASAFATEHPGSAPPRVGAAAAERPRLSFSLASRAGLVRAPFVTPAFPEVSGFATLLTPAAEARLSSSQRLHARLPITYVRLDFPAGAQDGEATLGNVEFGFEQALAVRSGPKVTLLAAALAPTAGHGSEASLLDNRALSLAAALSGRKDAALITPGVAGLRLGAVVEHSLSGIALRARLALPLLLRLSDASLPQAAETRPLGVEPALSLGAAGWLTPWFGLSLDAGLVMEALRVQEPAREAERSQRLQPSLEPGLHFQLGRRVQLALDATIPVGGVLGGEAWSVGPRGRVEL